MHRSNTPTPTRRARSPLEVLWRMREEGPECGVLGDAGPSKKECALKPTPYAIWRNIGPSMRGGQRGV